MINFVFVGLLLDTTTSKDHLVQVPGVSFEAVVAEEDPETVTDDKGLLIETTTGKGGPINKVAIVKEALEKAPRVVADVDVSIQGNFQDLSFEQSTTESPENLVLNITDPSDKPGSILTTLIDGFLLQKQPPPEETKEEKDNLETTGSTEGETAGGFPVTNILSGIYNLVSSYIQPTEEENLDEEPITAIPQNAINVHNMPRDQLIVQPAADPLPLDAPEALLSAPPLPVLPAEFLRGAPIDIKPRRKTPESVSGPVLILNENGSKGGTREPVTIPLPDLINEEEAVTEETEEAPRGFSEAREIVRSFKFREFVDSQPDPIKQHFIVKREVEEDENGEEEETTTGPENDNNINCSWNIKVSTIVF